MKKTDIAMIVLIAAGSMMIAFFATNAMLGDKASESQSVKTIEKITADVQEPDPAIFNSGSINPAVEVQITPKDQ